MFRVDTSNLAGDIQMDQKRYIAAEPQCTGVTDTQSQRKSELLRESSGSGSGGSWCAYNEDSNKLVLKMTRGAVGDRASTAAAAAAAAAGAAAFSPPPPSTPPPAYQEYSPSVHTYQNNQGFLFALATLHEVEGDVRKLSRAEKKIIFNDANIKIKQEEKQFSLKFDALQLDEKAIRQIVTLFPDLEILSLVGCNLSNNAVAQLASLKSLKSLDLSGNPGLTGDAFLSKFEFPRLEKLKIVGCHQFDPHDIQKIFLRCKCVSELTFGNNQAIDDALLEMISTNRQLDKLTLSNCRDVTNAGIKSLSRISYLTIADCEMVTPDCIQYFIDSGTIRELSLGKTITTETIKEYRKAKTFAFFEKNGFKGNNPWGDVRAVLQLVNGDVKALPQPIQDQLRKVGPTLTTLMISCFSMTYNKLQELVRIFPNVSTLEASYCHLSNESMRLISSLQHLEVLHLGGNYVSDAGLIHLAPLEKLRELDLSDAQAVLTGAGLQAAKKAWAVKAQALPPLIKNVDKPALTPATAVPTPVSAPASTPAPAPAPTPAPPLFLPGKTYTINDALELVKGDMSQLPPALIKHFLMRASQTKSLYLNGTAINSNKLAQIYSFFPKLEELILLDCSIDDACLQEIAKFKHLIKLNLAQNKKITSIQHLSSLKNLRELTLFECNGLTDIGLAALGALPQLNSLSLSSCRTFTSKAFAQLPPLENLSSLYLSNCPSIDDECLLMINNLFLNLRAIYLNDCKNISDKGLASLTDLPLIGIDLSGCDGITKVGIETVLKKSSQLEIGATNCKQVKIEDVNKIRQNMQRVEAIKVETSRHPATSGYDFNELFKEANGDLTKISPDELETVEEEARSTRELDLDAVPLDPAKLKAILELFPMLLKLSLKNCGLTNECIAVIGAHKNLESLELIANNAITSIDALRGLKKLVSLELNACNGLTDEGMKALGELEGLISLLLSDCNTLTSKMFTYLIPSNNLKELLIARCAKMDSDGLSRIVDLFNDLEILTIVDSLDIDDTQGAILTGLPKLRMLYLEGCKKLTDVGLATLSDLSLEDMHFGRCDSITLKGVEHFLKKPKKPLVAIIECKQITDNDVKEASRRAASMSRRPH